MKEDFLREIDSYMVYAYNIALRFLGAEDAKDAAQTAIIKAYEQWESFRGDSSVSTWLYRITINHCKDILRKRRTVLSLEDISEVPGGVDPAEVLEKKDLAQRISKAVNDLSIEHREVLILRELLGYDYETIACELGIPVGTVKSRIHSAKKAVFSIIRR